MFSFYYYHGPLDDLTLLPFFPIQASVNTSFIQLILRSFALYFAWVHRSLTKTIAVLRAGTIQTVLLGSNAIANISANAGSQSARRAIQVTQYLLRSTTF